MNLSHRDELFVVPNISLTLSVELAECFTAALHTHHINNACNGNRAHNATTYQECDQVPVFSRIAINNICTFAGNTAHNSAISPQPAACLSAGIHKPTAPANSAAPLNNVAIRASGTHRGTMRSNHSGMTKCAEPVTKNRTARGRTRRVARGRRFGIFSSRRGRLRMSGNPVRESCKVLLATRHLIAHQLIRAQGFVCRTLAPVGVWCKPFALSLARPLRCTP